jgi:hypothetical protein
MTRSAREKRRRPIALARSAEVKQSATKMGCEPGMRQPICTAGCAHSPAVTITIADKRHPGSLTPSRSLRSIIDNNHEEHE